MNYLNANRILTQQLRRRILAHLKVCGGEADSFALQTRLKVSRPLLIYHANQLERAGLARQAFLGIFQNDEGDSSIDQSIVTRLLLKAQPGHSILGVNLLGTLRPPDLEPRRKHSMFVRTKKIDGV